MPYGFRQEYFIQYLSYKSLCEQYDPNVGLFWPQWHNLNKLGRGPLGDATY